MYEELKEEAIVRKVGGRFRLSTLIQKRMVQLSQGARPLIHTHSDDRMAIVLQEIMQDKIYLDSSGSMRQSPTPDLLESPNLNWDDL